MFDECGWLRVYTQVINVFLPVLIGNACSALLLAGPSNSGSLASMGIPDSAPPYHNFSLASEIAKGCCRNSAAC